LRTRVLHGIFTPSDSRSVVILGGKSGHAHARKSMEDGSR